jgi:hypothetical protein
MSRFSVSHITLFLYCNTNSRTQLKLMAFAGFLSTNLSRTWQLIRYSLDLCERMRLHEVQWYFDVEDTARLHVIVLLSPNVNSERLFAFSSPFNWTDIVEILRKARSENTIIPEPSCDESRDLSLVHPVSRAEQLLRDFFGCKGRTSLDDSITNGIIDL